MHDVQTLAAALVFARTGDEEYRAKAADAISGAIGTERHGRTLALGRNLVSYVIAADLIQLRDYDPDLDGRFRSWLQALRKEVLRDGRTLIQTNERRPNNWGTMAGASRAAMDVYLGDRKDLRQVARIFKGWLGDRASYAGFSYSDDLSWQADPKNPVGINPPGAMRDGHDIGGALPEEMNRCHSDGAWPPCHTTYPWGGLGGALVEAEILYRAGYDTYGWNDRALLRAYTFLYGLSQVDPYWWQEATQADDGWQIWLVNYRYHTAFPTVSPTRPGKNMGFTDWTHSGSPPG